MDIKEKIYSMGNKYRIKILDPYQKSYRGYITNYQRLFLEALDDKKLLTQKEITAILDISKQHVSLLTKDLMEKGYIEKVDNEENKNTYFLRLTAAGESAVHSRIQENLIKTEEKFVAMTDEKQKELLKAIEIVENFFDLL